MSVKKEEAVTSMHAENKIDQAKNTWRQNQRADEWAPCVMKATIHDLVHWIWLHHNLLLCMLA